MAIDRELRAHKEWLGMVQPVGLVVSPAALVRAQIYPTHPIIDRQNAMRRLLPDSDDDRAAELKDFPAFCIEVLGWRPTPQERFNRLLRETGVPIGLLCNGLEIRLVYAPSGESPGHISFRIDAMCEVAGRPILAACHTLLSSERLFSVPAAQRLPRLLNESRKYQTEVSIKL